MKTFLEILQKDVGSYPMRTILDNLDDSQILECIEEYTNQFKSSNHIVLKPTDNCKNCGSPAIRCGECNDDLSNWTPK